MKKALIIFRMNFTVCLTFVILVSSFASKLLQYNRQYSISHPYYLQSTFVKNEPIHKKTSVQDIESDYEIPKWVYKKVFKYNRHNRYFDDDIQ